MRPPFEAWAAQEIANLRMEADALQRALDRYMGQSSTLTPRRADSPPAPVKAKSAPSVGPGRSSKYDPVWVWLDEAEATGLATEEVARRLAAEGSNIKRSSLRAFLWNQAQLGRLVNRDGRYVAAKYQDTGEPEKSLSDPPWPA